MLTDPQKLLHWRRWNACVHANDWRMEKTRLVKDARKTAGLSIYHKLVWLGAERLAQQASRGATAEDLRHSCYITATTRVPAPASSPGGEDTGEGEPTYLNWRVIDSMADLGNKEFSRTLVLWDLLIDPENLAAQIKWDHPENSEAEGLDKSIAKLAPDAYVRKVSARAYETRNWESLDVNQKRNLRRILAYRRKNWNCSVEPAARTSGHRPDPTPADSHF